jgi:hypothetical protein
MFILDEKKLTTDEQSQRGEKQEWKGMRTYVHVQAREE